MSTVITGSIAFDYLMTFAGRFKDHILLDQLDRLSLSFLVDGMVRHRGGIAANIAYTLSLLGEKPVVMAAVGKDFEEYRAWLEKHGVDTSAIVVIPDVFTASFFVNSDMTNAQIAFFYAGAMAESSRLHFRDLEPIPELAVISPNDPQAMVQYVAECIHLKIPYLYDPSQQIIRLDAPQLLEGIRNAVALIANDYEWGLIKEKTKLDLAQVNRWTSFTILTLGEKGIDLYNNGEKVRIPAIMPNKLIDPTGAGDAFRGGFLKGYTRGLDLEISCRMGALAATYCIEAQGTQGHSFDLETFKARYQTLFPDQAGLDAL